MQSRVGKACPCEGGGRAGAVPTRLSEDPMVTRRPGAGAPLPPLHAPSMTLLAVENASKSFAGVPALRSASLSIASGEIHALMGENGAGKSTLIQILAGALRADQVTIAIDGRAVAIEDPDAAFHYGLRFLHQELNIVPTLSVAENIFLGRAYPKRLRLFLDWARLAREAGVALSRLG